MGKPQALGSACPNPGCPETDSNRRHEDFQSSALPTELSGPRRARMPDAPFLSRTATRTPVKASSDAPQQALDAHECGAVSARRTRRYGATAAPIWARAHGTQLRDATGRTYLDLTSSFGAAPLGQTNLRWLAALVKQGLTLTHGLGDLHPNAAKARLLAALGALAPWPNARVMLGLNGADAIDAALKTALLATGRPHVVAFRGGYHGLMLGPLAVCGLSDAFRQPFAAALRLKVSWLDFPTTAQDAEATLEAFASLLRRPKPPGLVLFEPILGRGGVTRPADGFLAQLTHLARKHGCLSAADEILTGLGRTGVCWESTAQGALPDMLCAGKALGAGLPISALLLNPKSAEAWSERGAALGALHTATYFGSPLLCAAALAYLEALQRPSFVQQVRAAGEAMLCHLRRALSPLGDTVRVVGRGLLIGIIFENGPIALAALGRLRERGILALLAGASGEVLQLLPPLNLSAGAYVRMSHAVADAILGAEGTLAQRLESARPETDDAAA